MNVYVDIRSLKLYMKNITFFNSFNHEACHFGFMIAFKWHFVFKASNDMKIRVPRLQTVVCVVDTSVRDLKIIKVSEVTMFTTMFTTRVLNGSL